MSQDKPGQVLSPRPITSYFNSYLAPHFNQTAQHITLNSINNQVTTLEKTNS